MNTKTLMTAAALLMGLAAIMTTFFPLEIAGYFGLGEANSLLFQLLGALYFGFAMVNWLSKSNLIGGIYGRAIAMGNFSHFMIMGITLTKWLAKNDATIGMMVLTGIYVLFAVLFGVVLFANPIKK